MKQDYTTANTGSALRYGMFIPLAFMLASLITCCVSYSNARQDIANDLNDAMFALAYENSELWTRPDTVAAIRQMYETTHKPLIYQASDVNFRISSLKDEAYFTLALVDKKNSYHKIVGNKIVSDSIMLMPQHSAPWHPCSALRTRHCPVSFFLFPLSQWPVCLFGEEGNPRLPKPNLLLSPQRHRLMASSSPQCNGGSPRCCLRLPI